MSEVPQPDIGRAYYGGGATPDGWMVNMDGLSSYPEDLAGVTAPKPLERLKAEIQVAREMYRSLQTGNTQVDYARLAGALAGALDNIAFYAEWAEQTKPLQ